MNVHDARVVLRPRSLPDVIDLTLRVCHSAHARAYALWGALTLLPAYLFCLWLQVKWHTNWFQVWLLAIALVGLIQGVFTIGAGRLLFAEKVSTGQVLRRWLSRLWAYVVTLTGLRALPAISMVASPVVLMFPFIHEAVLLEDAGVGKAVTRSQRLTRQSGALAFELGVLILLIQALAVAGAEILGHTLTSFVFQINTPIPSLWEDGGSPFALAGLFLAAPYVATLRFLTYIDLRTRKEGWDLQLQLTALSERQP
jgi:hypothetical protein